jgi:propanediol utilization protein
MSTLPAPSGVSRERIERIVSEVLEGRFVRGAEAPSSPLVVNTSARHVHITQAHLEQLFGPGAELTPMRWLYQEGEFGSEQTVDLIGPKRRILPRVRILGPTRPYTQVELAFSDAVFLGMDVPVRMSGTHEGTPGCLVLGPKGYIELDRGVIRAHRHVHMTPDDAARYGVAAGDKMDLEIEHPTCPMTIRGIAVRVDPRFKLEVHIDTDEGNACDLPNATAVRLVKAGGRG